MSLIGVIAILRSSGLVKNFDANLYLTAGALVTTRDKNESAAGRVP